MANEVRIKVTADDEASSKFDGIGKKAATVFAGIGVAAAAGAAKSLMEFGNFEKQMNEVFTLLPGISDKAMGEMTGQVKDFSKEFGVLPEKTVPALYQALSAGVPKDNVFEFLETAQKAAKGGVTELETAVDGITSVVNAYGSDVIGAGEASDKMFTAVKNGKTNFEELSASLFNVIPTASSLGVEFGDVTAAMATMTSQGTPTSVATTQLRQALVEASKGGTDLDESLRDLHGKGFSDLIKDGMNTGEIFDSLRKSMPEQEFKDLFGSVEAMNAALAITGPNAESFNTNLDDMKNSAGATDEAFETMDQGMNASMDKIKANLSVLALEVGEKLAPAFAAFTDWILSTAIPAMERFSAWFGENVVPVLQEVGSAVKEFVQGTLIPAFDELSAYIDSDLRPAFDNIKAAVQSVISFVSENWGTIMEVVGPVIDEIKNRIQTMATIMQETIGIIVDLIGGDFSGAWERVKTIVSTAIESVKESLSNFGELFAAVAPLVLEGAKLLGQAIWKGIQAAIDELVIPGLQALPGLIKDGLSAAGEGLLAVGKSIMTSLWDGIKAITPEVLAWFGSLPGKIKSGIGELGSALLEVGKALLQGLWDGAKAAWEGLRGWLAELPGNAVSALGAVASTLLSVGKALLTGLWDGVKAIWNGGLKGWLAALPGNTVSAIGAVVSTLLSKGKDLLTGLWNGVKAIWNGSLKGWLAALPGNTVSAIGAVLSTLLQKGKDLLTGLWNGVKAIWNNNVSFWFGDFPNMVVSAVGAVTSTLLSKGKDLITGLWNGIKNMWESAKSWLSQMPTRIKVALGNLKDLLWNKGRDVVNGLWEGIKSLSGWIKDKVFGFAGGIYDAVSDGLGKLNPFSPSEKGVEVGEGLGTGIEKGMKGILGLVKSSTEKLGDTIVAAMERMTASIEKVMKQLAKVVATITDKMVTDAKNAKDAVADEVKAANDIWSTGMPRGVPDAEFPSSGSGGKSKPKNTPNPGATGGGKGKDPDAKSVGGFGDIRDRDPHIDPSWFDSQKSWNVVPDWVANAPRTVQGMPVNIDPSYYQNQERANITVNVSGNTIKSDGDMEKLGNDAGFSIVNSLRARGAL